MKTKKQLINEIKNSDSNFIVYGDMETPITKKDALKDIHSISEGLIGNGDWMIVDSNYVRDYLNRNQGNNPSNENLMREIIEIRYWAKPNAQVELGLKIKMIGKKYITLVSYWDEVKVCKMTIQEFYRKYFN